MLDRYTYTYAHIYAVLILTLGAFGCAKNDSGGAKTPIVISDGSRDDSCDFTYTQGPNASAESKACQDNLGNKDCQIETTHFEKKYNAEYLRRVSSVSAKSTAEQIKNFGADVYQAPRVSGRSCDIFSALDQAPSEVQSKWAQVSSTVGNGGYLAGFYLDALSSHTKPTRGTIMVIANGSRHVLLHEMMHHLFALEWQKKSGGKLRLTMLSEYRSAFTNYYSLKKQCPARDATRECTRSLTAATVTLLTLADEHMVTGYLEESAIEALLLSRLKAGTLGYVSDFSQSAFGYFEGNIKPAIDSYNNQQKIATELMNEYSSTLDYNSQEVQKLQARSAKISERLNEMSALTTEMTRLRDMALPPIARLIESSPLRSDADRDSEFHCGFTHEMSEVISSIKL
jgi:hypothetical protein